MSCFSPPKLSNNICKVNVFLSQGKLDVFGHTRQGHWAEDAKEPKTQTGKATGVTEVRARLFMSPSLPVAFLPGLSVLH